MKYIYGIQRKSDTYKTLQIFLDTVVYRQKCDIEVLCSDNGTEFTGKLYQSVLSSAKIKNNDVTSPNFGEMVPAGVVHRKSASYTQAQNGIAERAIGSIAAMTRSLLKSAGKPSSWWLWAAKTSCYLLNRIPTHGLSDHVTPYELMHSKKPQLRHLQPWGSDMMMYYYDHQQKKLDDRARLTSFVMYSEDHSDNTYVGYDAQKRKEYTSLHVAFDNRIPLIDGVALENDMQVLHWRTNETDSCRSDSKRRMDDDNNDDGGYGTDDTDDTASYYGDDDDLNASMDSMDGTAGAAADTATNALPRPSPVRPRGAPRRTARVSPPNLRPRTK